MGALREAASADAQALGVVMATGTNAADVPQAYRCHAVLHLHQRHPGLELNAIHRHDHLRGHECIRLFDRLTR
jgi:hypothetical protein